MVCGTSTNAKLTQSAELIFVALETFSALLFFLALVTNPNADLMAPATSPLA
jgi:hypothetical protein